LVFATLTETNRHVQCLLLAAPPALPVVPVAFHFFARQMAAFFLEEDTPMLTTRSLSSTLDRMLTLNRALDEALTNRWSGDSARVWVPAIDVAEKNDAYLISVELPGVDRSAIDISFEQNVLTVRGTKGSSFDSQSQGELRVYAAERVSGTFERSIRLPEFVDGDHISADFTNGLLSITVPKAQAAQPRRVQIRGGDNAPKAVEG
jgi:HSP20 family protein